MKKDEITLKNTKAEILEALNEALEREKELEKAKYEPQKEEEKRKKEKAIEVTKENVEQKIFSEELNNKFKDLEIAIKAEEEKLKELYGIEKELSNLVVIVNAGKDYMAKLENEKNTKIEKINSEIKELEEEYQSKKEELEKEYEMHIIELPKFKKKNPGVENKIEQWLWTIIGEEEKIEMAEKDNKEIKKAIEIVDTMSMDKRERELYEARLKGEFNYGISISMAKKEGEELGKNEEKLEIAKKMLSKKMPIKEIKEITGLTDEEIKKLKAN